jgi:molybdate transport system substrate-binding protein
MMDTKTSKAEIAAAAALALGLCLPAFTGGGMAHAADIKVLSAVVMKSALDDLARDFERASGHKVTLAYAPAGGVRERIQGGEAFELTILPRPVLNQLLAQGKVVPDGAAVLARSAVSVCVRAGAAKPDISSVNAFRRSLLATQSVAYSDPAKGGASGVHFARVLEQLGIAQEMKPKAKLSGPDSAEFVARGEAEICVTQAMEIVRTAGVELVGPLPPELQNTTDFVFAAGVGAGAREAAAALSFIKYLRSPDAMRAIKAKGMEPGGA